MTALTETQLKAAEYLAAGMLQEEAAKRLNVTRVTISRWNALAAFKAEVERRRQSAIAQLQQKADELQAAEIDQFFEGLKAYRDARLQIYQAKLSRGIKGLNKIGRRFDDLPEEAIAVNNLASLFSVFDTLTEKALEGWAEIIGLDEVMRRLEENGTEKRD
jgi:transcriptional regulator with XRE-family HTH domain